MPVTTREYFVSQSNPVDLLNAFNSALMDLSGSGWVIDDSESLGYLTSFTNTAGATRVGMRNERYLVTPSYVYGQGSGSGAVFDVLRGFYGNIASVQLVTGGSGYSLVGRGTNVSSSGATVWVGDTRGMFPGQLVTRIAGSGTLQTNTIISSVNSASGQITLNQTPSVALSAASIQTADIVVISSASISGRSSTQICTGSSGATTILVTDPTQVFPGQTVTGSTIPLLTTVSSIAGNLVTISRATTGAFSSSVTFSDELLLTVTGIANKDNIFGTVTPGSATITNVATNANLYVGARVTITSGAAAYVQSSERMIISSIAGSGPYTITLRNPENTFKGFTGTGGTIEFKAAKPMQDGVEWFAFDNYTAPLTYAWGVFKLRNSNKLLGTTFWHVYFGLAGSAAGNTFPTIYLKPMTGFNPVTNVAQGALNLDIISAAFGAATSVATSTTIIQVASSYYVPITLRVRQSGIDPKFATWAFFEGNNNKNPFFISHYENSLQPWSLDDVFLGGSTELFQLQGFNGSDAGILFRQRMGGLPKRVAEAGYGNYNLVSTATYTNTYYRSVTGNRILSTPSAVYDDVAFYSRQYGDLQTNIPTAIPIYKTIPINPHFIPVPYYLPDDFGIAELPWVNAAIRDTITISPSEVWTIIQTATNQTTFTTLALVARTT